MKTHDCTPKTILNHRYRLLHILGKGSVGVTYAAQDLITKEQIAIKTVSLRQVNNWKQIELLEREAKILAKLNHPAIPKYLDYWQIDHKNDRLFYIAQQLAPGKSLFRLVEHGWHATEQEVRQIATQILNILSYLHSLNPPVIHRDIKPHNLIRSNDGKIFLVDFGAVQNIYHNTFMKGNTVVGTYGYMAPEQFRGQAFPATDLYGLGATILYLLTHRSPAELPQDTLKIDFRSRLNLSEDFANWLEKILEPDSENRFTSAQEALKILQVPQQIKTHFRPSQGIMRSHSQKSWHVLAGLIAVIGAMIITPFIIDTVINTRSINNNTWKILSSLGYKPVGLCENYQIVNNYLDRGGSQAEVIECILNGIENIRLHYSEEENTLEIIKIGKVINVAIEHGIDIKTILWEAASRDNAEIVKLLIKRGTDVNAKDNYRNIPLLEALYIGNLEIVKLLINHDVNVKEDSYGITLLLKAVSINNVEIVKLLISHGADVNIKNNYGITPLLKAVSTGNLEIAGLLIDHDADVNAKNNYGDTSLLKEASTGNVEMVKLLISHGANVNAKNNCNGNTPLSKAVSSGNVEIVKLLISHGADAKY